MKTTLVPDSMKVRVALLDGTFMEIDLFSSLRLTIDSVIVEGMDTEYSGMVYRAPSTTDHFEMSATADNLTITKLDEPWVDNARLIEAEDLIQSVYELMEEGLVAQARNLLREYLEEKADSP